MGKNRSCNGKNRYTKAEAKKVAFSRRILDKTYVAYRCQFCGGWHVGHNRKSHRGHKKWN